MLVNFGIKNFKTFKEKTILSFEKGKKRELNHHIIHTNNYELLPIKVIYGGNACGKSNLLEALHMQKTVVTYRGCVEGLQEVLYFNHLQNLINNCDKFNKRVNFNFKNANGGSASKIVHKAKLYSSTDNMKIAVFDHDFKEEDFIKAISDCEKYKIFPAYSNISFNLFLILHKKKYNKKIINNVYEQPYLNINKFLELVFKELNE